MMNKNVINVAKFSFISSIKSKVFIVFNVIIFICMLVLFNFSTVLEILNKHDIFTGTQYNIDIKDENGNLYSELMKNEDSENIGSINKIDELQEYSKDTMPKDKIVIDTDYVDSSINVTVISKEKLESDIYEVIDSVTNNCKDNMIVSKYNISDKDASIYNQNVKIDTKVLNEESVVEENYTVLTFAMTMLIYFLIIFGTNAVASQIANEKTSKSAEYVFSSIPAKDYLNGKILGANLKTLSNMLLIIFYALISLLVNSLIIKIFNFNVTSVDTANAVQLTSAFNNFDSKIIIYLLLNFVFILLTSILLSYIQAGITARVKSVSDIDSSQSITLTIIIIAYFLAFSITGTNNIFTKIVANIPIFSMFLMPVNYLNDVANIYTVLLSIVVLLISIVVVMNLVSRTFKKNILEIYNKNSDNKEKEEVDEATKQINIINKNRLNSVCTVISISLICLVLIQFLLGILLAFVSSKLSANIYNVVESFIFVISMAVPILIIKMFISDTKCTQSKPVKCNKKFSIKLFFIGITMVYIVQTIAEIIISKLSISSDQILSDTTIYEKTPLGIILLIIQMAVLPGIFEELLFRKHILNNLNRYGNLFSIVLSALAFALIHLNLSQGIVAFLIGMVFAYIVIKTGNLKVNISLHIFNNLLATLMFIFENNSLIMNVINYVYIALAIIGGIVLIYTLFKDKKSLMLTKNNDKYDKKVDYKPTFKDIIFNYYTIILLIFIAVMMVVTY